MENTDYDWLNDCDVDGEAMTHQQLADLFTALCRPCDPSEDISSGYVF